MAARKSQPTWPPKNNSFSAEQEARARAIDAVVASSEVQRAPVAIVTDAKVLAKFILQGDND